MGLLAMLGVGYGAEFGSAEWWIAGAVSVVLVLFAGIMSGLTLGLMSLGLVDLEVLQRSGSDEEKKQASKLLNLPQFNPFSSFLRFLQTIYTLPTLVSLEPGDLL